ncbi:NAD-dependent epimerase/dehydratase [Xylanimonas cellulosilytica DSM 15894]|uniref:NAD-dependent epimerase/dehydratase n=1 Tax=Xylanimonas cellulosilytica (strain DSM 15894 / JCM 12276 / CECT 5975 / KCTC 9989 / LMG 20990 / NBRC 107835 / XIL07) TaxID=446471 RepID=D1BS54_XYLCX|nr:TIGR01777 family oxidoreductase [Xylanimonas cellulosilytica]ACZ30546.1 NAD-dependent epimerase/dehydratase [Xylanimonas cellulosilytica DSM 15894]
MDVAVSGASGLIGSALRASLEADGHQVVPLLRPGRPGRGIAWDPEHGTIDASGLESIDAVVHLAGEGVAAGPWTHRHRTAVLRSRVDGTRLLAGALAGLDLPPSVLVSGSAIGYYGSRGDEPLPEDAGPGHDFLARVCIAWEAATAVAEDAGIRTVHVRTGMVLAPRGGALGPQRPLFRAGLGAKAGRGTQWVSWIHLDDEVGAIRHAITRADVAGAVNLAAPHPVTNAAFARAFAASLGRRARLTIPRLATAVPFGVGQLVDSLLFASQRVAPDVLEQTGYRFEHPELAEALAHV